MIFSFLVIILALFCLFIVSIFIWISAIQNYLHLQQYAQTQEQQIKHKHEIVIYGVRLTRNDSNKV